MLIKLFTVSAKDNYREVLKGRRTLALAAAALGLTTMVIPPLLLHFLPELNGLAMGYYSGSGAAVFGMGLFAFFRIRHTLRDETLLRNEQIKETDERTLEISRRAASIAILLSILALYISLLVVVFINRTVYLTLICVLSAFIAIFLGSIVYYKKKL